MAPFCHKHGGLVINMAINIRNVVVINTESFEEMVVNPLFKGILDKFKVANLLGYGLEIRSREKGSGLGSSGSFAVAAIGAVRKWLNIPLNRYEIAAEAFKMETETLGWHGGCQDQFAAAYGGFNLMEINREVKVRPFAKKMAERLYPWMVLFDSNVRRRSYKIQEGFREPTNQQTRALLALKEMVFQAKDAMRKGNFHRLGKLLDKTWEQKKKSNKGVSNKEIDGLMGVAKEHGALGGKVCGAGGGGFCWFICEPKKRNHLIEKLEKQGLKNVDFGIDWQGLEVRMEK